MENNHYKFNLIPLEYDYNALEPYIDSKTVEIHHNKHLKTYVDNLNNILSNYKEFQQWSLEKLIKDNDLLPICIRQSVINNAGGVYNHNFYFNIMTPNAPLEPAGILREDMLRQFNSFEEFKSQFKQAALNQFGSGWAWLVVDSLGKLKIISTKNQDTPLTLDLYPIMLVDVWEHAYYLKYQNRRADYLENWFNIINWQKIEYKYTLYCKK